MTHFYFHPPAAGFHLENPTWRLPRPIAACVARLLQEPRGQRPLLRREQPADASLVACIGGDELHGICGAWWLGSVLGGELPTNRGSGLVHPSFVSGRLAPAKIPLRNNQGQLTHLRFVG